MIKISSIKLPLDYTIEIIKNKISKILKINFDRISAIYLLKRSVDARIKENVHFAATFGVIVRVHEEKLLERCKNKNISIIPSPSEDEIFCTLYDDNKKGVKHQNINLNLNAKIDNKGLRPVVVGFGPAGIFAALNLAEKGLNPIVIERGMDVRNRTKEVNKFWNDGILNIESNVQFGEGGAGAFSDGKLTTGVKSKHKYEVLKEFVRNGAPKEILYESKPHIGTDKLKPTIENLRNKVIALGGEVRFNSKLNDISIKDKKVVGISIKTTSGEIYDLPADTVILAVGHSARDVFELLNDKKVTMEQKPFSMGFRVEHPRELIDRSQYGEFAGYRNLPSADYKLSAHLENGRGVYTFCMCPGGEVIASSSEQGAIVTNGMSNFYRDSENSNSALLVSLYPGDFCSSEPLAGVAFQRKVEQLAFKMGGSNYYAPAQRLCDFLENRQTKEFAGVMPSYKPGVKTCNLNKLLPNFITESIKQAIPIFERKLHGFGYGEAVLTGVETRSSSPVRILRNENYESISVKGLYPCAEGAGYAGGIMSCAIDAIKLTNSLILISYQN